jgi:hypothetical protein
MLGNARLRRLLIESVGKTLTPGLLIGTLMYIPLLNKMRDNIVGMGLSEERLYAAMNRFRNVGERSAGTRRLPTYQVLKWHSSMVVNRAHPYHLLADRMVWLSARFPQRLLGPIPTWFNELTYEPVAS